MKRGVLLPHTQRESFHERLPDFFLFFLGALILLSRIPFMFSGYGLDPDAYYILLSARKIWVTGQYWMSRAPGYPLFEIVCALFTKGGFWTKSYLITNGMTILICLLTIFPLVKILEELEVENPRWLLIIFYFIPIVWIQSTCTMDYMWAFFFLLMSYYFYLIQKYWWGAIFLGIAVGFRITSGLMIFPLSVQLLWQEKKLKPVFSSLIIFGLTAVLAYSPVLLSYGFSFWDYAPNTFPFFVWGYRTISQLFGLPAFFLLIFGLLVFPFKKRNKKIFNAHFSVLLLIVISYSLLFFKLPAETAYLIPIIPFGLILLDRLFPRRFFVVFCILLLLNGMISLATIDKAAYKEHGQIKCNPVDYGVVLKNEIKKRAVYKNAQKLLSINENLPKENKTVVIISWYWPVVHFLHLNVLEETSINDHIPALRRKGRELFYLEGITIDDMHFLKSQQFKVFYLDAAIQPAHLVNVDLSKYGEKISSIDSYPVNY